MRAKLYGLLRRSPLRYIYHRIKAMSGGAGQSDESDILVRLACACPKTFVEFGFHPTEYNCIGLKTFSGLLVDGDPETIRLARTILPKRIHVWQQFITRENLGAIAEFYSEIGVLSVDVDGNDYWFLETLLPLRPHIVCVEYNPSIGYSPLSVPYDPAFDRHAKHPSGWYHGASLSAMTKLCKANGLKLVAIAEAGGNAFFVRRESPLLELDPRAAFRESVLRNRSSGTTVAEQWLRIRDMPFVEV
jgi:hypothetical protein